MKKIVTAVAAAILALGAAFAEDAGERSIHWIGFNVPIENMTWTYDDDSPFDSSTVEWKMGISTVGFNVFYNHLEVGDNRFTKLVDVQLGYTSLSVDSVKADGNKLSLSDNQFFDIDGFDTRWMFGLGGAPLNFENVVLSVGGTFGLDLKVATGSKSYYVTDVDVTAFDVRAFIGLNTQAAFKLTDSFGLSAGIHIYTNVLGLGTYIWTVGYDDGDDKYTKDHGEFIVVYPGDFNIDLKFGVCFMF